MAEQSSSSSVPDLPTGGKLKSHRARRAALWILGIFLFLGLFGYFAGPPILKSILVSQMAQVLHRDVRIEKVDINPYALTARINGLSVQAAGGKEVAGFDEVFINLSSASIFKLAAIVDELRVQGLRLAVVRLAEGRYDISDLLDEWMKPKEEPSGEMPRFSVNNIQLIGGNIEFDDQPIGKVHRISDINLALPFVSSLPHQVEIFVEPSFSAQINDAPLVLKGRSKPFSARHESELDLDLDHFDLSVLQPYLPESFPLRLPAATLDTEMRAVFKEVSDQVFSLTVLGSAHVSELTLIESSGSPLLAWKKLDIEFDNADLFNQKIAIKRIALDGLDSTLSVNSAGEFNILNVIDKLLQSTAKEPPDKKLAKDNSNAKSLEWSLGEFELSNSLIRWRDESKPVAVVGEVRELEARVGKLDSKLTDPIEVSEATYRIDLGERFRVDKMSVKGMQIDLPAHRIDIAEVTNHQTRARMLRNKAGQIEWVSSPLLKTIRATDAKVQDDRPWIGKVGRLNIEDLSFRFEDQATQPGAIQELEQFNLRGENLTNEPGKKGKIALQGKVNKKGRLDVKGDVQVFPLDVSVQVETNSIPLLALQPYFADHVTIALTRGQLSNKGEASIRIEKSVLKAGYKGSVTFGDLLTVDKENSSDFLKWKSLYLGGIDFRLEPMAITVGEIALTDFYSRLVLNSAGSLNVQDIVRQPAGEAEKPTAAVPPKTVAKPSVPLKVGKITVQNGTLNFSDFFVKPNYSVNVTRLGGRITDLSTEEGSVADLDMRGSYANTAPVQIVAKLNPLAAKSFLDLKADVTGIDLVGFSPYSGKYAGYNIEKGKLSLNVAYKLENQQLRAENKLFIDQFTFGEKVESPDATSLPVSLAVSLLKNNRGEIDINLPISGSLDDPEFSVGGLIIRVIGNLIVKAATSPFALLGSAFGDGEELSNVSFAPGRATVDDAAGKKLTVLAKALNDRSTLKLEITGRSEPEADLEGLKRVSVERALQAEKLKEILKKGGEGESLEGVVIAPEEYKTYLTRAYKEAKFPKPRNFIGLQKDLPVEEMEKLMLSNVKPTDEDMRQLAKQRAENVQVWLIEQGKVAPERIFLLPPKAEADAKSKAMRADFSLR